MSVQPFASSAIKKIFIYRLNIKKPLLFSKFSYKKILAGAVLVLTASFIIISLFNKDSNAFIIVNPETKLETVEMTKLEVAESYKYTNFLQGCPKVAYYNKASYIVYGDNNFDVYVKKYDHQTKTFSVPYFVGAGENDHTYPCIQADEKGYLHIFYGSRPNPIKYRLSRSPEDPSEWFDPYSQEMGEDATYPVPSVQEDKIFLLYRDGYGSSKGLYFAVNNKDRQGWMITNLVQQSTVVTPLPLDVFKTDLQTCFLFNMRDQVMSDFNAPFYTPSIRESLSVICTTDGKTFTDINGRLLLLPLNYTGNYYNFPRLVKEYLISSEQTDEILIDQEYDISDLDLDGSVIEFEITKDSYEESRIKVKQGNALINEIIFQSDGQISFTNNQSLFTYGQYQVNKAVKIRLKYYFSKGAYRAFVNGSMISTPLVFYNFGNLDYLPITQINTARVEGRAINFSIKTMRDYKLSTGSVCLDNAEKVNLFFEDRQDNINQETWALMHYRSGKVRQISPEGQSVFHPTCINNGDSTYVLTEYFDNKIDYPHSDAELHLLRTRGVGDWEDIYSIESSSSQTIPVFAKPDGTDYNRFTWVDYKEQPIIKYGYFNLTKRIFVPIPGF